MNRKFECIEASSFDELKVKIPEGCKVLSATAVLERDQPVFEPPWPALNPQPIYHRTITADSRHENPISGIAEQYDKMIDEGWIKILLICIVVQRKIPNPLDDKLPNEVLVRCPVCCRYHAINDSKPNNPEPPKLQSGGDPGISPLVSLPEELIDDK